METNKIKIGKVWGARTKMHVHMFIEGAHAAEVPTIPTE